MKQTLEVVARLAQGMSSAEFQRTYPDAALLFIVGGEKRPASAFETSAGGVRVTPLKMTDSTRSVPLKDHLDRAARKLLEQTEHGDAEPAAPVAETYGALEFLRKTDRNPFSAMIIVGRAGNSDVCIQHTTVSKVHAYLRQGQSGSGWTIADYGSTNGTFLNGQRLKREPVPLPDGATVDFGHEIRARFFSPEALYRFTQQYRSGAPNLPISR
jgi:hypothetical protein